jgi:hypothetical protein
MVKMMYFTGRRVMFNSSSHGYEDLAISLAPDIPVEEAHSTLGNQWHFYPVTRLVFEIGSILKKLMVQ